MLIGQIIRNQGMLIDCQTGIWSEHVTLSDQHLIYNT